MIRDELKKYLEAHARDFEEISDKVWGYAETPFQETKSSELQADFMEKLGFRVKRVVSNMPTAFTAEWGEGKPVIAILGENDALAALSQKEDVTFLDPIQAGQPGHGCGHNMLGTGGMEAALAVKEYLAAHGLKGTIRYYACPAEEGGGGKVFMVLDHQFDDVDATITWHPSTMWDVTDHGLAILSAYFRFEGKAAHAALAEQGRSALDALELMNVGLNFLREHVRPGTIMHYSITNTGGNAANIVQQEAEGFYILRNADQTYLAEVYDRVCDIAKGAALMTGTTFKGAQIISNYANILPNDVLNNLVLENTKAMLPLAYTEEELAYGEKFKAVGTDPNNPKVFDDEVAIGRSMICSDVCDVSWVTPLVNLMGTTLAMGTVGHSWGTVAQGKSASAKRGMHASAEIMANSAIDLIENPELVAKAKEEFDEKIKNNPPYSTLMVNCSPEDFRQ